VVVYGANGEKKGEFGKRGTERGQIESAAGMWIDAADRIYVADQINRRIAVFQITKTDGSVGQ
jgi:hypothetical protein